MPNLFKTRLLLKVADEARSLSGLKILTNSERAVTCRLILGELECTDVSDKAKVLLDQAYLARTQDDRRRLVMDAFWDEFKIELHPEKFRLLIHGPEWFAPKDGATLRLSGHNFLSKTEISAHEGEFVGYFTNVTLFGDYGIPVEAILDRILPGSTITLVRPHPETHHFWMLWCGFDPTFSAFLSLAEKHFALVPLHRGGDANVEVLVFGLEAKVCSKTTDSAQQAPTFQVSREASTPSAKVSPLTESTTATPSTPSSELNRSSE